MFWNMDDFNRRPLPHVILSPNVAHARPILKAYLTNIQRDIAILPGSVHYPDGGVAVSQWLAPEAKITALPNAFSLSAQRILIDCDRFPVGE
jgi:hypothetical protein